MSATQPAPEPAREVIAPRHESLRKEFDEAMSELMPGYGEVRLWLVARDPHWLFAYWEFNPDEHPGARGEDGAPHFFIRVQREDGAVEATVEIQPSAGNWYVPVRSADCGYSAELGFYTMGAWAFLAHSGTTRTPPVDADDTFAAPMATIPARLSLAEMRALMAGQSQPGESTAQTAARVQDSARRAVRWTPEQERMLVKLLAEESKGSKRTKREIAKRIRKKLAERGEAAALPEELLEEFLGPASSAESSCSSSAGAGASSWTAAPGKTDGSFLHVNAELIFYGGVEPGASLTVDGKPVQLRHDGTFRFHARMPDGDYEVPIVARSADGREVRNATLRFSRATQSDGKVGAASQPDYLPPEPPGRKPAISPP